MSDEGIRGGPVREPQAGMTGRLRKVHRGHGTGLLSLVVASVLSSTGCQLPPVVTQKPSTPRAGDPSTSSLPDPRAQERPAHGSAATTYQAGTGLTRSGSAVADAGGPPRFQIPEIYLALMRDPDETWLRTLLTPERDPRTGNWRMVAKTRPDLQDRAPSLDAASYMGVGGRAITLAGVQIAGCTYGNTRLNFWFGQRPALDAAAIEAIPERYVPMADVAIRHCPDQLGEALRLALGPDAGVRIAAAKAAQRERDEQRHRADRARVDAARVELARWKDGAAALEPARVAALWQAIDRAIKAEEARGTHVQERPASAMSAPTEAFVARMRREVYPPLLQLSRGAVAQASGIPEGQAGRAAFDRWDRGAGGLAMNAIGRLQRLWPAGWWHIESMRAIEADLRRVYAEQLRDKGLFDASMRDRVVQALVQRRLEAGRRVEPPQALVAATVTGRIVFLRPGELAAYRLGQDIGAGLRGLGQAVGQAGQVRRMVGDLDKRLAGARRAFWSCWEARCADIAGRWVDYSQALREKDWYYLSQEMIDTANHAVHGARGAQMTELFQTLAGLRTVDGGPRLSCMGPFNRLVVRAQEFVQQKLMRNPFDFGAIAAFSDELLASDEQRDYQVCRDAMEMAMRPRS